MSKPENPLCPETKRKALSAWGNCAIILIMLLFATAFSFNSSLRLRPSDGDSARMDEITVAVGVPYYILARKAKTDVHLANIGKRTNAEGNGKLFETRDIPAEVVDAKVDNPSLVKVMEWRKDRILVTGLAAGETTLRVSAGSGKHREKASLTVRTAVPNAAVVEPSCDSRALNGQVPVLIAAGRGVTLYEMLLSGKKTVLSNRYPEVDFGALIPPARVADKFKTSGKIGELIGPVMLIAKAPATPVTTVVKIPEKGYELPVQVIDASAVSDIRVTPSQTRSREEGTVDVEIELLVGDRVPCVSPVVPVEITVGPGIICSLRENAAFRRTQVKDSNFSAYEGDVNIRGMQIFTKRGGTCKVTAKLKASGKTDTAEITILRDKKRRK